MLLVFYISYFWIFTVTNYIMSLPLQQRKPIHVVTTPDSIGNILFLYFPTYSSKAVKCPSSSPGPRLVIKVSELYLQIEVSLMEIFGEASAYANMPDEQKPSIIQVGQGCLEAELQFLGMVSLSPMLFRPHLKCCVLF